MNRHPYGGNTAEIQLHTLMPHSPAYAEHAEHNRMHGHIQQVKANAMKNVEALCLRFTKEHDCVIHINNTELDMTGANDPGNFGPLIYITVDAARIC
jgi:hypothetical protein